MKLIVLGSGGYHPNEHRHTACYFFPDQHLLLDCGTGAFRLERFLPEERLTILLSHGHLDHVVGITYLLGMQSRGLLGEVTILGPARVLHGIREHLFSDILFPVLPQLRWHPVELGQEVPLPGDGNAQVLEAAHRGPTVNYLLQWPECSVAYLTDTTISGSRRHAELLRNVDLLMHECYFPDGYEQLAEETGHSCFGQVVEFARSVRAKRLLLIHLNPWAQGAEAPGFDPHSVSDPPTQVAEDLLQVDLP
jgi:ribonuclease BN (tRNA processing enzyme)